MEEPADREKQAGPAWVACHTYSDQLTSIGFTYEHERWALTMEGTAWRYILCACSCVPECVRVLGMPEAKWRGRRRASANIHKAQQAAALMSPEAMRQKRGEVYACNTQQHPEKGPTSRGKSMQHAFTSPQLPKPQPLPPIQPTAHQLPSKPTFTIQAAVHPRKESILNPTGLALLL